MRGSQRVGGRSTHEFRRLYGCSLSTGDHAGSVLRVRMLRAFSRFYIFKFPSGICCSFLWKIKNYETGATSIRKQTPEWNKTQERWNLTCCGICICNHLQLRCPWVVCIWIFYLNPRRALWRQETCAWNIEGKKLR